MASDEKEYFIWDKLDVQVHIKMREVRKCIMYMCIQDRLGVIHVLSKNDMYTRKDLRHVGQGAFIIYVS